jgi:glycerol-3-phosphate dehydrogenase
MVYCHTPPEKVSVLILGGGIHGVGLLHDLVSRGFRDCHLLEKKTIGSGTSSRSTKLIHGGLRYLRRLHDFSLVYESLRERRQLLKLAPDLVHPLEILLPCYPEARTPYWMSRAGLSLYDLLAFGKGGLPRHGSLSWDVASKKAPLLKEAPRVCSFWDGQTDDLALVERVAGSAIRFGGQITEYAAALSVKPREGGGWLVETKTPGGQTKTIQALHVMNFLGPWSHHILEESGLKPVLQGVSNKGIHLLLPDLGFKAGVLLESPLDGRVFFLLPWLGSTLIGTTEAPWQDPNRVTTEEADIQYLMDSCNFYLKRPLERKDILQTFAGLRWLAQEEHKTISLTSREALLGEHRSGPGILWTLYGGKLTSYRSLSEKTGDKLMALFEQSHLKSRTGEPSAWASKESLRPVPSLGERFAL